MKHFTHYLTLSLAILSFGMFSCQNDDDGDATPTTINYPNPIPTGTIQVNYTIQAVPGNGFEDGRISAIDGATVTLTQNGESVFGVTDGAGMVHFTEMLNGTVSGSIEKQGYVPVNFTAVIDVGPVNTNSDQVFYSSSTVTMFERNSALSGRIWGDYINLGVPPPDIGSGEFTLPTSIFVVYNVEQNYPMGSGNGRLTSVNMAINTFRYRTSSNGRISLEDIPGTVDGLLTASLFMEDVAVIDINNTGSSNVTLFNIHPVTNTEGTPLNLVPGIELQLGDKEAKRKIQ